MLEQFKNDLLNLGKLKIVSSFDCDPAIGSRSATDDDRQCRKIDRHPDRKEFKIVLDGECDMLLDNTIYHLFPGCVMLVDNGEEHQEFYPDNTPPGRHFTILLMPEHIVYSLITVTGSGYRNENRISGFHHYDPYGRKALISACDKLREHPGEAEYRAELSLLLQLRAVMLIELSREIEKFDGYNPEKRNRFRIEQIMDYIDTQCGRDCSIAILARMACCSRTNFLRNFRRYAGCSVLEYVNRQRIQRLRSLLKASYTTSQPTPLKTCAQELGFSSPQAFARWRKQHLAELRVKPETGK